MRRAFRIALLVVGLAMSASNCARGALPALAYAGDGGLPLPGPAAAAEPGRPVLAADGLYVPPALVASSAEANRDQTVPALLALHGMGGSGGPLASRLLGCAQQNGWVLIAPSLAYRDYMDAEQVRLDDREDLPRLVNLVDAVRDGLFEQYGLRLDEELLVYGFSRGGQLAHRFAFFYPDRVAGVASLSAGAYTLPRPELAFPFGVADLAQYAGHPFDAQQLAGMPFWVGVGQADTDAAQVPRRWDPYIGQTRLERARRFSTALQQAGASVQLNVFAGVGHEETALMRERACAFFSGLTPIHSRG